MLLALAAVGAALCALRIHSVSRVRWARLHQLENDYAHLIKNPEKMTYQDAAEIMKLTHYWDFPWMSSLALSFALFKTYAIPTISKVLNASEGLSSDETVGRRAEDTGIFIGEFLSQGLDSKRGSTSLARMNWLHSRWGSQILQSDLLFTLALFVFEPITVLETHDWRPLTSLEQQARFVFWAEIGARMGIENIPSSLDQFWEWKEAYAEKSMTYDPENAKTGEATLKVLLRPFPTFMRPIIRQASMVLIDTRTREAFGWAPASPSILYTIVPLTLRLRALFIKYFVYPRTMLPGIFRTHEDPIDGTITREGFLFEAWYIPPGCSRIGMFGIDKPGSRKLQDGKGWKAHSIGPENLSDKGHEKVLKDAEIMREQAKGCPFFRP